MPVDHGRDHRNAPIETPTLASGRWRLRPVADHDQAFMFATMTDPGMIRARSAAPPAEEPEMKGWIRRAIAASEAGTSCTWVIEDGDDDRAAAGLLVLQEIDRDHGVAEAGYYVAPRHRRSGAATACLDTVATWAFDHLDLVRVQLFHDTDNPISCRVATGAGFAAEGVLRSSRRRSDGTRADQEVHARLRDDGSTEGASAQRIGG
ncbi:MAG: GNAT family N-acetyltransferase [Ilumatobacter sp.]|nr:GNAT family N-acetyltransferase [Ilumatobacter sp.]